MYSCFICGSSYVLGSKKYCGVSMDRKEWWFQKRSVWTTWLKTLLKYDYIYLIFIIIQFVFN
jgi:hypothetical protein